MIFDYETVPDFLNAELRRRVEANSSYSLRAFAKSLHLSPGALSDVLKDKRNLSTSSIQKVSEALGLSSSERLHLSQLVQEGRARKQVGQQNSEYVRSSKLLSEDIFSLVSEWYHFAILNLVDCEDFRWDSIWIAKRLGLTRSQSALAMDLLIKLGFVEVTEGVAVCKTSHVASGENVPSEAIRKYHKQILEKAIQALETQGIDQRDISGIGFAIESKNLPAIKKDLAKFQDKIIEKYSSGNKDEVYFLEMALFSLTQGGV